MSLILPTLYLLLITICLMIIFDKSFCLTLPFTLISTAVLIMIAGYISDLRIGVYLPLVVLIIAVTMLINKKRNIKNIINIFNLICIIVFLLFVFYIGIYHKNSVYRWWDDYSHWGPMVKGMFKHNKLYTDLTINNAHKDYPPLIQCFEYLWCYLARGYSEPSVYRAISLFTFSLFFPTLEILKEKKIIKQMLYTAIFVVVIILLNAISYKYLFSYLEWIYIDFSIATLAGITIYLIYNVHFDNSYDFILIASYLSSLLLIKEIGIAFYAMAIFIIFFKHTIEDKKFILKDFVWFIVIPFVIFISWKIKTRDIAGQFSFSNLNLGDLFNIVFLNKGTATTLSIKESFFNALYTKTIIKSPVNLSFIMCVFISVILIILLTIILYKKKERILLAVTYLIGVFGYIFTMLILYLSCFSESEATGLASFERYFGIYIHFSIVLISLLAYKLLISSNKKSYISLLPLLLICSNVGTNYKILYKHNGNLECKAVGEQFEELVKQLESVNFKDLDKLLIFQRINDLRIDLNLNYIYIDSKIKTFDMYQDDKDYVFKDKNELINLYKDYDYVYVYTSGQTLWDVWKKTNNDPLYNNRLYKVIGDRLVLVPWISTVD